MNNIKQIEVIYDNRLVGRLTSPMVMSNFSKVI